MKKLFVLSLIALLAIACAKVPFTGRKQTKFLPESTLNAMALTEYKAFLSANKTETGGSDVEMVRRVGNRIRQALANYYRSQGMSADLKDYNWEFNLVDDPTVNAWAMPGGKVVVYSGLLPIAKNEDGLAVVMGHEIAHAIAHHGNERMSQGVAAQLGGVALSVAISDKPAQTQNIFMQAYGLGSQVGVLLPFSRKHESEADEIGLYLMAMAGYNPAEAEPFWKRMNASSQGQRPPEFLSTHPDPAKRSETLRALVPKARAYAQKYPLK